MTKQTHFGFTLIELMMTMVIALILAAIAYPVYINQIQKTRRTDGIASLLELQAQLERCYTATFSYTDCTNGFNLPQNSTNAHYSLAVDSGNTTGATYALTAIPQNQQANDTNCASFTVNHLGQHVAADNSSNDTTAQCWP